MIMTACAREENRVRGNQKVKLTVYCHDLVEGQGGFCRREDEGLMPLILDLVIWGNYS